MFRRSVVNFPQRHYTWRDKFNNVTHKYRELTQFQRKASGKTSSNYNLPGRKAPLKHRFNPDSVMNTKGTSSSAFKWWYTQQAFLPNVAPKGFRKPRPSGRRPNAAWDDAFTAKVTSLSNRELNKKIIDRLTKVIFEESQRDGFELRKLDFEGRPLEKLPEKRIIEQYVFEEETLRDRVLSQVVETDFRLAIRSEDRKLLKSVKNIVDFIFTHVIVARSPKKRSGITTAVRDVLAAQPVQPLLGFRHALPFDSRDRIIKEWERMHQLDWQFGKAIFKPNNREVRTGNFEWLRAVRAQERRDEFDQYVKSGRALADHKARIAAAAAAN